MADTKITALTALTAADPANDVLPIVDVSDTTMAASGTTKKISVNNILGASGTATLASATITGDLTVDTNTLKVDSANDNVGIGTTTPASYAFNDPAKLVIANTGTAGAGNTFTIASGSTGFGQIAFANGTSGTSRYNGYIKYSHSTNAMEFYANAGALQATLNSTGLGVGVASPATKLDVRGANNASQATFSGTAGRGLLISTRSDSLADDRTVILNAQFATGSLGQLVIQTAGTDRLLVDASGNVGISRASTGNKLEAPGVGVDGRATVGGVSTVATTIYTIKQSATAAMCVVFGDDGLNGFCDIVLFLATVAPKVVSSQTLYGSPAARTYSTSTTNLQLALASGTLSIRTAALSTLNT